ncbi:hypothetical protein JTE90_005423 [Oedothorax gibbosus]|uniref:Uncharacterized protein n=1 Tax=Oedothorax gibbosus TaxID=931172 RepID=A0AAV6UPF7_9ARAC|nr:hypothetical protein JTE90_005423 [Oedothorax gibbosus]
MLFSSKDQKQSLIRRRLLVRRYTQRLLFQVSLSSSTVKCAPCFVALSKDFFTKLVFLAYISSQCRPFCLVASYS